MIAPQNFVGALKNWNFLNNYMIYSRTSLSGHLSTTATCLQGGCCRDDDDDDSYYY